MADCACGYPSDLGERIRYWREKRGYTQAQLAEMMGDNVKPQTVSSWEREGRNIGSATIVKLAKELRITPNDLLMDNPPPPPLPPGLDPRIRELNGDDIALINGMIERCYAA